MSTNHTNKMNAIKQQKQFNQLEEQYRLMTLQHRAQLNWLKENVLGKFCLVGVNQMGINRSFVTGVEGDLDNAIAVRLSAENNPDDGEYFDVNQVKFFKIYSEEETKKFVSEYEEKKKASEPQPGLSLVKN